MGENIYRRYESERRGESAPQSICFACAERRIACRASIQLPGLSVAQAARLVAYLVGCTAKTDTCSMVDTRYFLSTQGRTMVGHTASTLV